ncbi:lasso peptide isopeptide bond-forming cyclase [Streptomyces sp. TRM 70361]|uniref:lasso peptide isopeptide bond-forming cyclase n=1 Tax=Streptomyces sp. TRM 70361 TaxID=3116553 RepID=UPI002E7BC045|nr:lasso peptide isopeptide bond-forming cyclase [Streptomyces sp. TRM 70361]MEE1943204.1 lasso peptide isopeptide bond-forming cyclase [Streptomyces sp. TRM 70361]
MSASRSLSPARAPAWFVVLPDSDAASDIGARARTHASRELAHPSGRPWLLGRWPRDTLTVGDGRGARVAVLGEHRVTDGEAARAAAAAADSPAAFDRLTAAWPGSFHLLASAAGRTRVQGGVTGVRRVFHGATTGPVTVAGDRADVVADLLGGELDETRLAVQLLTAGLLHPFSGRPLWRGVERLPGDHCLLLEPDGRARRLRRWSAPEPAVPLAEGAAALARALTEAVEVRTRGRTLVTADLGGLDSTAVCCTAARGPARVVAYTAATHDPLGDDVHWARRTVAALGSGVEHHLVPAERIPLSYDGLGSPGGLLDAPCLMTVDHDRRMSLLRLAAERGSALHLTGLGGDELLGGSAAHLHAMIRTRPLAALHRLRGYAAKYGWSRRQALRQLADRRSYPAWLRGVAADLRRPQPAERQPLLEWCAPPRLPPWVTADAADAVRDLLRAEASAVRPLAPGHGAHRELVTMDLLSRFTRHVNQLSVPLGVVCSAPYYDDRVVEAALAVRPQDRITPYRYKPLIVEAMRGIVPEASRTRATRANATLEEVAGQRRHRDRLLALCEDSRLGRLGLVDPAELRRWCARPLSPEGESELLHPTVACEVWLRSREAAAAPSPADR